MVGEVKLLVVDFETDMHYRSQRIIITGSMCDIEVTRTPASNPAKSKSASAATTDANNRKSVIVVVIVAQTGLRVLRYYYVVTRKHSWSSDLC